MHENLLETVADIAYIFGAKGYFSGDSRADTNNIIYFAKSFESEPHDWYEEDYLEKIYEFSIEKIKELKNMNSDCL